MPGGKHKYRNSIGLRYCTLSPKPGRWPPVPAWVPLWKSPRAERWPLPVLFDEMLHVC